MEIVRTKEKGTLRFEIFLNRDESEATVFEHEKIGEQLGKGGPILATPWIPLQDG